MLDLHIIRTNPDIVLTALRHRNATKESLDSFQKIIELDAFQGIVASK